MDHPVLLLPCCLHSVLSLLSHPVYVLSSIAVCLLTLQVHHHPDAAGPGEGGKRYHRRGGRTHRPADAEGHQGAQAAQARLRSAQYVVSVLIVGLSYGARNVLSYTRHRMQHFLAFRDSPIIPLRR